MRPTTKVVRPLPHKERREIATTRPLSVCIRWKKGGGLEPGGSSPLRGQGRLSSRCSPAPCAFRSSAVHLRVDFVIPNSIGNCQVDLAHMSRSTYIAMQDSPGGTLEANPSRHADNPQHEDIAPQRTQTQNPVHRTMVRHRGHSLGPAAFSLCASCWCSRLRLPGFGTVRYPVPSAQAVGAPRRGRPTAETQAWTGFQDPGP